MSFLSIKTETTFSTAKVLSQMNFAAARALTMTAKDAQSAVLSSLADNFTLRGQWFDPRNKYGIRIRAATKTNLEAEVFTNADWLTVHELGADKFPLGKFLAVPTDAVRRNKKQIIQRSQRPRNLKNTFLVTTKSGAKILLQRKGRGKNRQPVVMYRLIERAKVKKQSTFYAPVERVVKKNLSLNFKRSPLRAIF